MHIRLQKWSGWDGNGTSGNSTANANANANASDDSDDPENDNPGDDDDEFDEDDPDHPDNLENHGKHGGYSHDPDDPNYANFGKQPVSGPSVGAFVFRVYIDVRMYACIYHVFLFTERTRLAVLCFVRCVCMYVHIDTHAYISYRYG
jgi:hypothetical protein